MVKERSQGSQGRSPGITEYLAGQAEEEVPMKEAEKTFARMQRFFNPLCVQHVKALSRCNLRIIR